MSLSLAKRSLREFDQDEVPKDKKLKKTKKPKAVVKKVADDQDEKVKKLLLLSTSNIDDEISKRLLKKATKGKSSKLMKSGVGSQTKATTEAIFTEEDFQNFAEDWKLLQNG